MEKRTEESILEVLKLLPEPPRIAIEERDQAPRVVLRVLDEQEHEVDPVRLALRDAVGDDDDGRRVYHDLLVFERPGSDDLNAAWMATPLVFKDFGLVRAVAEMINWRVYLRDAIQDFSKAITAVLRRHPGPVSFFYINSSACPAPDLLEEWVNILSQKSVASLTVVNLTQPQENEFPLHRLRGNGSLTSLTLAFFNLAGSLGHTLGEDVGATFGALTTLTLAGCSLDGQALSTVIRDCCVLTTLCIWGSELTAGCYGRELIISSHLSTLHLLRVRVRIHLTLDMPALNLLTLDVSPAVESRAAILLARSDALRELKALKFDRQNITYNTSRYVTVQRRKLYSLQFMKRLSVTINMSNAHETWTFINMLHSMPCLSYLEIERADCPTEDEALHWTTASLSCRCVADSLQRVAVKECRGGAAELEFLKAVLNRGLNLSEITISPHASLTLPRRKELAHLPQNNPTASTCCVVTLVDA